MKPSLSAPTLTDFAAAIAAEFNRSAELPEPVNIKCAVNRGKLMVLAQHTLSETFPARPTFSQLEQQVRQQLATLGLPETVAPQIEPEQLPIQLYLKQASQPKPYAAHRFIWHMSDAAGDLFRAETPANAGLGELRPDETVAVSPSAAVPLTPAAAVSIDLVTDDVAAATELDATVLPADIDTAGDSPLTHPDSQDHREPVPIPTIESTVTYPEDTSTIALNSDGVPMTDSVNGTDVDEDADDTVRLSQSESENTLSDAAAPATPVLPAMGRSTEALPTKHGEDDVPEEEMIFLPDEVEDDAANRPESVPMWDGTFRAEDLYDRSEVDPAVATVDDDEVLTQTPMRRQPKSRLWAAGLLSAAVVGTGVYMLSRPCVLGRCDRIPRAESLGDAALVELADNPSPQTVKDMQQQLSEAVDLLRPIPVWSFQHGRAQTALQNYQRQLDDLDSVIAAQQDATAAAEASQSPPHPVSHWQAVATQWETAIARLQTIPPESPIYNEIVAPKLEEYQGNLATIQGRIDAELNADTAVNQATQSGSLATQQTEIATNLETWETALASWETAVSQLKQIPRGTLAYGEAQKLLPEYESELSQVRTRTRGERIAEQFYTEAAGYATEAREYETQNQWTLAMIHWRDAITQAEGVPEGTARYTETQDLLKTYRPALSQAQENLRQAQRYQKAEADFVKACGSGSQLCSYTLRNGKVIIRLAEGYDDLIELSITPPDQRATAAANTSLTARANQLFNDLTNIGKRTQIPIELQDSNGAFIARFKPELNGYVKH
ncbi:MAG: hypothetical protein AAFU71_15085 [Cyanobacteria bacterium J06632_22]